uniref:Ribosomal protein L2 n=1 Tax=Magnolia lacei TaxID=86764 RepID=A0A8K1MFC2_9MAGN|nr:ribosomal protein L2 [Magnolia lacei]UBU95918.1 ribosomal protein L2 [Magnolia lacei]
MHTFVSYTMGMDAYICLIHYGDGEKRYILHPRGAIIGDTIVSGTEVPISMGNALPLSAV